MGKEIGKVIHSYDKIGVAVVRLSSAVKTGDTVKVKSGDAEFEDVIASMQVDHKEVSSAKKGAEVAMKLSQKAKEGSMLYVTE